MQKKSILLPILVLGCFLNACGGGGGSSSGSGGTNPTGGGTGTGAPVAVNHTTLTWDGSPGLCLSCHSEQAKQMYASAHYQWQGEALYDAANGPLLQGKISNAFNSYCINILGNWNACGSCHAGLDAAPVLTASPTDDQLKNIDCLICHQKGSGIPLYQYVDIIWFNCYDQFVNFIHFGVDNNWRKRINLARHEALQVI